MLSDAGQCSWRAAAACYVLHVTHWHCLGGLKGLLTLAFTHWSTPSFIRFGQIAISCVACTKVSVSLSLIYPPVTTKASLRKLQRNVQTVTALLLSLISRLLWECLRSSASKEKKLRGVTGGRTGPALLWKADHRPGEAHQQPPTWTGRHASSMSRLWCFTMSV